MEIALHIETTPPVKNRKTGKYAGRCPACQLILMHTDLDCPRCGEDIPAKQGAQE
jgi:rRNA maturation endonuclease Nob1